MTVVPVQGPCLKCLLNPVQLTNFWSKFVSIVSTKCSTICFRFVINFGQNNNGCGYKNGQYMRKIMNFKTYKINGILFSVLFQIIAWQLPYAFPITIMSDT